MNNPLDEACDILNEFEQDFKQVSSENWQEKHHRMWLHGATDVWECNEFARWLTDYPSATSYPA